MRRAKFGTSAGVSLVALGAAAFAWGGALRAAPAAAAAGCTAPGSPGQGGVTKSIDTDQGCDNGNGQATDPATGWIAIGLPAASTSARVDDAFQALPADPPQRFFQGSYSISFDSCSSGGTISDATYDVTGDGDYPSTPPPNSAAQYPITVTGSAGATVICHYSLAVVGSPPSGMVASFKNELFVVFDNNQTTQTATVSVKPFNECAPAAACTSSTPTPTPTPENGGTPTPTPSGSTSGQTTSNGSSSQGVSGAVSGTETSATSAAAGSVLGTTASGPSAGVAAAVTSTPNTGAEVPLFGGLALIGLGTLLVGVSQRRRR